MCCRGKRPALVYVLKGKTGMVYNTIIFINVLPHLSLASADFSDMDEKLNWFATQGNYRKLFIYVYLFIYLFISCLLPIMPVGLRETLDGWPPPVSSAGQIF